MGNVGGGRQRSSPEFQAAAQRFQASELRELRMRFKSLAERSKGSTVDKASFLQYFPLPGQIGERLFHVFDTKHTGVIDFEEFVCGLAMFSHGSKMEKLKMLFDIYDMTGDGAIHKYELQTMLANIPNHIIQTSRLGIEAMMGDSPNVENSGTAVSDKVGSSANTTSTMVDLAFQHCDLNKDGKLSFEQFSIWVDRNGDLMEWFETATLRNVQVEFAASPKSAVPAAGILDEASNVSGITHKHRSLSVIFAPHHSTRMHSTDAAKLSGIETARNAVTIDDNCSQSSHSGWLSKQGGNFKMWKKRWYCVVGNFCYYYHKENDGVPAGVFFMDGCLIEATEDSAKLEASNHFGIDLIFSTGGERDRRVLYASSKEERDIWIEKLRMAAKSWKFGEKFKIGKEIGRGKFSTVYVCKDTKEGLDFAVKVVSKTGLNDTEFALLRSEIAVLKQIDHPNAVALDSVYETKFDIKIVMELVAGGEMFNHIVGRPRLCEDEARRVVNPIAKALRYLHSIGIVHRDIKPENILCNKDFTVVKLADFGLSKLVSPNELLYHPCGTPLYVAPEVLEQTGYSTPADMWSVGVIMFLVLRGRLPYDFQSRDEAISTITNTSLDFNDRVWCKTTKRCRDVVSCLLQQDPASRLSAERLLAQPWCSLGDNVEENTKLMPE